MHRATTLAANLRDKNGETKLRPVSRTSAAAAGASPGGKKFKNI